MTVVSTRSLRLAVGWILITCSSLAWAVVYDNTNGVRRADGGCWAFAKTPTVVEYSTIDPKDPRAPAQSEPDKKPATGSDGGPPDLGLEKDECAKFLATPADGLFNVAYNRSWYRRSDFVTQDHLTPIDRWTTRYVYRRTALSGAGAELGLNEDMLSLGLEIDAYRVSYIRSTLFVFSPDAYWVDTERRTRWKMYLTPTGRLALVDITAAYEVQTGVRFHRDFPFSCKRDEAAKLVCGLQYQTGCEDIKDMSKANDYTLKRCEPENRKKIEEREGRIALFDNERWYPGVDVKPDKIIISRRYSYSRKNLNQQVLSFYASFDDPIRPVYFAAGLLFTDKAKPHPGKSRPGERVMTPVCLVDCPDQLAAQGLLK